MEFDRPLTLCGATRPNNDARCLFSDSHTESEVVYEWGPVTVEPYLTVPKYSLLRLETGSCLLQTSIGIELHIHDTHFQIAIYIVWPLVQ